MQMQVGTFRFDVSPGAAEYTELTRRRGRRWASRDRHGLPAQLEDLGRDAEVMNFRGTIWVRSAADIEALDTLRSEAGLPGEDGVNPRPLAVFRGGGAGNSGEFLGMWVVTRLTEREQDLRFDGAPARIAFELSLLEHVE